MYLLHGVWKLVHIRSSATPVFEQMYTLLAATKGGGGGGSPCMNP